jgi:hypothetical protein
MRWRRLLMFSVFTVGVASPLVAPAQTRVEETALATTVYTGAWFQSHSERAWSGGTAALSNAALSRATLTFRGTGVSWVGLRGPQAGVAKVYLDGVYQVDVDCYATSETVQAVLFTRSGLAAGAHTLAIEATGTRNTAATDAFIAVDAFDVEGVPRGRVQETGLPTTVYTGDWFQGNTERAWSGGTAAFSASAGAHATLMFIGTGVSWIGFRGPQGGIARVSLDGVQVAPQVDTYAAAEQLQVVLFSRSGLTADLHILTIDPTGTRNPAATDAFIVVDAFDVTP